MNKDDKGLSELLELSNKVNTDEEVAVNFGVEEDIEEETPIIENDFSNENSTIEPVIENNYYEEPIITNQEINPASLENEINVEPQIVSEVPKIENEQFVKNSTLEETTTFQNEFIATPTLEVNNLDQTPFEQNQINNIIPNEIPQLSEEPKNKKDNKKIIIIAVIVILVGVIVFFIYNKFMKEDSSKGVSKDVLSQFEENSPILVKKDDKYGYIDSKGKYILEPKYKTAYDFYGKYAVVEMEESDDYRKFHIIDNKGNIKLSTGYFGIFDYESMTDCNMFVFDDKLYNFDLKQLSGDKELIDYKDECFYSWENSDTKEAGIMNSKGEKTYKQKIADDEYLSFSVSNNKNTNEQYCILSVDEKEALVNCNTGKVVYDYDDINIMDERNNIFSIYTESSGTFIETIYVEGDEIVYKTENKDVDIYYSGNYLKISDSSKDYTDEDRLKFFDIKKKSIVASPPEKEKEEFLETDYKEYKLSTCNDNNTWKSLYGLYKNNQEILKCEYSEIEFFPEYINAYFSSQGKEYVILNKDKKQVIYDLKAGKDEFEFQAESLSVDESTFVSYYDYDNDETHVYNLVTKKEKFFPKDPHIYLKSNYILVKENSSMVYYNMNLEEIFTGEMP